MSDTGKEPTAVIPTVVVVTQQPQRELPGQG